MKDFGGWVLLDKVMLVCRPTDDADYQAYMVDPKNKKQIEGARKWAADYNRNKEITEFIFDNNDFDFELFDSAYHSSQGGKLSFWNCIITKDNKKFKIGINTDLLLELLIESTFINGKCQEKVLLARKNGNVGALHKEMKFYKDALKDMETKETFAKNKSSKAVIGHNYITIYNNNIYLGDVYDWFEPVKGIGKKWGLFGYEDKEDIIGYRLREKPIKK